MHPGALRGVRVGTEGGRFTGARARGRRSSFYQACIGEQKVFVAGAMYDALKMRLHGVDGAHLVNQLDDGATILRNGVDSHTGTIDGMKIWISGRFVSVRCNLPKHLKGNNIETATRGEAALAIAQMSERLGLPLDRATVSACEIGASIVVEHAVSSYFPLLGTMPRHDRMTYGGRPGSQLLYRNTVRGFSLYDKGAEQRLPATPGRSLMRVELDIKQRLRNEFRRPSVLVADLWEPGFHRQAVDAWRTRYYSIARERRMVVMPEVSLRKVQDLDALLSCAGIAFLGGMNEALDLVMNTAAARGLPGYMATRFKRRIRSRGTDALLTVEDDRITELDARIDETAARYLEP